VTNAQTNLRCDDCSWRLVDRSELDSLSAVEINHMADWVYFKKRQQVGQLTGLQPLDTTREEIDKIVGSWYEPLTLVDARKKIAPYLSVVEASNIRLFDKVSQLKSREREQIILMLKEMKRVVFAGNKRKAALNYHIDEYQFRTIKSIFEKVKIEDIQFYKNKGFYHVSIDNGLCIEGFVLSIEGNIVKFLNGVGSQSEIIPSEEAFLYFSNYGSEGEFFNLLIFKYENNKLLLIEDQGAG
jgi:hypothetical protein